MSGLWDDACHAKFSETRKVSGISKQKIGPTRAVGSVRWAFLYLPSFSLSRRNGSSRGRAFQRVAGASEKAMKGSRALNLQIWLIIFLFLFQSQPLEAGCHTPVFFFED